MGDINPNVYKLIDPLTKATIIGIRQRGGMQVMISCYNKIYDKLSHAPENFKGMVFDVTINDDNVYAKVIRYGSSKFLKKGRRETFPPLQYETVVLKTLDNLSVFEALEDHKDNFKDKK